MKEGDRKTRARRRTWIQHLRHEWLVASFFPIAPAFAHPQPAMWDDARVTAAWLGHSTVLINFFGIWVLTDPVLFPRCGIRMPFLFTIGPKRLTQPALRWDELPPIDLVLLSHAHFDHLDTRTLHRFSSRTKVITALRTSDLLRWTRLRDITELRWGESCNVRAAGELNVKAFRVQHWGARMQTDNYRGYNGYILERNGRRVIFGGDSAWSESYAELRDGRAYDLAIMAIGAYDPWIRAHCTPEQAVAMCDAAGVEHIMPVHHQTFRLSFEEFREPIERFAAVLEHQPERIALREIGETFVLP
jgi:L-ascorbate metabolism protein UlaG (beta-lactamase superfamily)